MAVHPRFARITTPFAASSGLPGGWLAVCVLLVLLVGSGRSVFAGSLAGALDQPAVVNGPNSTSVESGESALLEIAATGGTLSFQWYRGSRGDLSQPVVGGTGPRLLTPPLLTNTSFWVRVSNDLGSVDSAVANVTVATAQGYDLYAMGNSYYGQLGIGASFGLSSPILASGVSQVAAGSEHSLFLKSDGTLWSMGANQYGQLGDGTYSPSRPSPVQIASNVARVVAFGRNSLFITTDGSLWAMGENNNGQLGGTDYSNIATPVKIASDVIEAAAAGEHSLFVTTDGTLWSMGYPFLARPPPSPLRPNRPPVSKIATDVVHIAAGYSHGLFIKTDGSLWAFSYNIYGQLYGQLGDGIPPDSSYTRSDPVQIASDVASVAANANHSLFIKTDGSLWAMGYNGYGQLGDNTTSSRFSPVLVADDVAVVVTGSQHSLFIKTDGSLWAMGDNTHGQIGAGNSPFSFLPIHIASNVAQAAAGDSHSLFVKTDGSLWAAGKNDSGQLSDVFSLNRSTPVPVTGEIARIAAGGWHSLFLKTDGSLWAAGQNDSGQLGDGSTQNRASPVQVASAVRQIAAGMRHSLFIKTDGSLWAMGYNELGQLGDGSHNNRLTPVQIATDVAQISAGIAHSLFLKTDGSLWAMGRNSSHQLGDGYTPVPIASDVVQIAAGGSHSLFIKTDGSLWAMGDNYEGQLGDGSYSARYAPVPIASDVVQIAAGDTLSLFLKSDGSLWYAGSGLQGDGRWNYKSTPVQIASDVVRIAAGWNHGFFIKNDTSLWAMGSNEFGQLGNGLLGSLNNRSIPVQVATGVVSVAAGDVHSLFIQGPTHAVRFDLGDHGAAAGGGALVQRVISGRAARAPLISVDSPDWSFQGWDTAFNHITADLVVHAVYRHRQTITFLAPNVPLFDPGHLNTALLSATASSGLPVGFEVVSGPATLGENGTTLNLADAGIFVIRASQPGDEVWDAAAPVEYRFTVRGLGLAQKITFATPAPCTYGDPAFTLEANASSGLPVTLEIVSGPAFLDGDSLTVTDVGRVVICASQPGGAGFGAAPNVTRTLAVNKAPLTVTVADNSRFVGEDNLPFTLSYSGFVGPDAANESTAIGGLDRPPVARCKATRGSPQGNYAITLSGGSDDHYDFHFANPAGSLRVLGFGGTYEALLLDQNDGTSPIGKLTLTVPTNGLSYTGILTLAREARPLSVSSTSPIEGTTPFVVGEDRSSASATWNHAVTDFDSLTLTIDVYGRLIGSLTHNRGAFAILAYGRRLYVPRTRADSPWSGQHTLTLYPGTPVFGDFSPFPQGFGYASGSIRPSSGIIKLIGKLADGALFTASVKPTDIGSYLLWTNPYGSRTQSFLAGVLADDSVDLDSTETSGATIEGSVLVGSVQPADPAEVMPVIDHGQASAIGSSLAEAPQTDTSARPPLAPRDAIHSTARSLTWKKAALSETTPASKRDKSYRAGFGPLVLPASLDAWLPPVTKSSAAQLAVTLAERLGLAQTNVASGELVVSHLLPTDQGYPLPTAATLTAAGRLLAGPPNPTSWKITALDPATGTFRGQFVLTDSTPTDANPDQTTRRAVSFSATLRQSATDSLIGAGFFLLPALPGAESDEQVSGEIRFTRP